MRTITKVWLVIAVALVLIGCIVFAGVMSAYEWDFAKLSTVTYVTNTYEVNEEFDKISINVDTTKIEFAPAENEECSIICFEAEKAKHSAAVQNGTLVISMTDTRNWYDYVCISVGTPKMTVYLPQSKYASLFIETDTGDITIPKDFSFEALEIDSDTSDVDCLASVSDTIEIRSDTGDININTITAGQLSLTTTTGNIWVNSVAVRNDIDIETDTGKVQLTDTSCTNLFSESDTGDATLKNVMATGGFFIESDTGDVSFENSDAAQIAIKTSTGDVTGTLLTDKIFVTETSTGNINVPKTASGGRCEITTSTGDIEIYVAH